MNARKPTEKEVREALDWLEDFSCGQLIVVTNENAPMALYLARRGAQRMAGPEVVAWLVEGNGQRWAFTTLAQAEWKAREWGGRDVVPLVRDPLLARTPPDSETESP